jgi:hypothetical protein
MKPQTIGSLACRTLLIGVAVLTSPFQALAACARYPTFTMNPPPAQAREADMFVDSIAVVWKLTLPQFKTQWAFDRLKEIGVRHVRGNITAAGNNPTLINNLYNAGARIILSTDRASILEGWTGQNSHDVAVNLGPEKILGVEGINEPECCGPDWPDFLPDWPERARTYQQQLFNAIKGDPQTRNVMVFGPAFMAVSAFSNNLKLLGNVGQYMDSNNHHGYPKTSSGKPGVIAPEDNPNAVIGRIPPTLKYVGSPQKPVAITEFCLKGAAQQAVWTLRYYLLTLHHGVWKDYYFTFIESDSSGCSFVNSNGTLKPVFYAVKNIIKLLNDPGQRFSPETLDYSLSGNTSDVYRALVQKRDGTFYLALWVGGTSAGTRAVTLSLPSTIASAATVRPTKGVTWQNIASAGGKINLNINGDPLLVKLTSTAGAPQLCPG